MFAALFKNRAIGKAFARIEAKDGGGLRRLLEQGADANGERKYPGTDFHQGLLLCAVEQHAYECVGVLCQHGADPNRFNEVGNSPFLCSLGHMRHVIQEKHLNFTAESPYESQEAFTSTIKLFHAGGNRAYRPPGFRDPVVFDAAGPSPEQLHFEVVIDAWLNYQGARMTARLLKKDDQPNQLERAGPRL